jgi:hypothetical protein
VGTTAVAWTCLEREGRLVLPVIDPVGPHALDGQRADGANGIVHRVEHKAQTLPPCLLEQGEGAGP